MTYRTDRQTHRQTYHSVCDNRPHLADAAMRPNSSPNKNDNIVAVVVVNMDVTNMKRNHIA